MKTLPCRRTVGDLTSMANIFYPFSTQSPSFQCAFNSLLYIHATSELLHYHQLFPMKSLNLLGKEMDITTIF